MVVANIPRALDRSEGNNKFSFNGGSFGVDIAS